MNIYKMLWSRLGGRPWTYIYRDLYHKYEWFIQTQWFFTGVVVGYFFGWKAAGIALAIYTFGYINGHFFWGRDWKEGQGMEVTHDS